MKNKPRMLRLLATLLVVLVMVIGCDDDDDDDEVVVSPTTGGLRITVSPSDATVMVSGPNAFSFTDSGDEQYTLDNLEPGSYTVSVSATGFTPLSRAVEVSAGESQSVTLALSSEPEPGRPAFFVDNTGQLVEIPATAFDAPGNFVFHAWLEDEDGGITTAPIAGAPTADEQFEIAPSSTQNLAVAFVGFISNGEVRPVVNAAVRWQIDRQFAGAVGSVQFGAADDGSNAPGATGDVELSFISGDQADTFTNTANVRNLSRFPISEAQPLHNRTGVLTPDTDGFTWVTLFSPDANATARVVAVASVNGTEIGKALLIKNFAPTPVLAIEKTVAPQTVVIPADGSARVIFTVTVTNSGNGDATNIVHLDRQTAGPLANYTVDVATLPAGAIPVDQDSDGDVEGFDLTLPALAAGAAFTFTFESIATAADAAYCNTVTIESFATAFETVDTDLFAEACFTTLGPTLAIDKDFVDAAGNSLGNSVAVAAGEVATLRVQLINSGTADATGVVLSDVLSQVLNGGAAAAYSISNLPVGAVAVDTTGFNLTIGTIPAGQTVMQTFNAQASADGTYCDTASFGSNEAGSGAEEVCLTVATPGLTIVKSNAPTSLVSGGTYTSTATVTNTGNAPAMNVTIRDTLGVNNASGVFVEHVSSSLDGTAGTFDTNANVVTFPPVTLAPGQAGTVTITSRIPNGAPPGNYCNIASFTSDAVAPGQVEVCVQVLAFAAVQIGLSDDPDPVTGGTATTLDGTLFNEERSNENLINNTVVFNLGAGQFAITATALFFDSDPTIDADTGLVVSGPNDADRQLVAGTDFTVVAGGVGVQTITLAIPLAPGQAVYTVHTVQTPDVGVPTVLNSTIQWTSVGMVSGLNFNPAVQESTTLLP